MRPATVAKMMRDLAEYLDVADELARIVSHGEVDPGTSCQGDLLLIAAWFEQHPEVDAQVYAVLDAVEVE